MTESFLGLDADGRREALLAAESKTGRPAYLLEKDIWVVWTLNALFNGHEFSDHLVFKGGTSLSKAYGGLIKRFSEDIDLTYDIRQLIPDLTGDGADEDPLPPSRSKADSWTKTVLALLPEWITSTVVPALEAAADTSGVKLTLTQKADKLHLRYDQLAEGHTYVQPEVLLEFGARSSGEPASLKEVTCDAAPALEELAFPQATPRVMNAERTFWEKATAAHVYCLKGNFRGDRYARHWYDIARLADAGIASNAIADRPLAESVAKHKKVFFREKAADGSVVDYLQATSGGLKLVPEGDALSALQADYQTMISSGLFEQDPGSFEALMEQCREIEAEANAPSS